MKNFALLALLLLANTCFAQTRSASAITLSPLSGTVQVGSGQSYGSLTGTGGLFDAINTQGLSGNLTAIVTSNLNETGVFALHQWTETGGSGYTLDIFPDGTTERLITGNVDSANGMIRIQGADRVTIDGRFNGSGRFFRFRNTNDTGTTISLIDGVNDFTLRNCFVEGSDSLLPRSLVYLDGCDSTNNGITIRENVLSDRTDGVFRLPTGIFATGMAGTNDVAILNNEFVNIKDIAIGLDFTANGDHWIISGNSFYATRTVEGFTGIAIGANSSSRDTISGNYFGGQAPLCGGDAMPLKGDFHAINITTPGPGGNAVLNNIIQNIDDSPISPGAFTGITLRSPGTIRSNLIGHPTDSSRGIICTYVCDGGSIIEAECDTVDQNTIANFYSLGIQQKAKPTRKVNAPSGSLKDGEPGLNVIYAGGPISSITRNRIYSIRLSGEWASCTGINANTANSCSVGNNMISLDMTDTTTDIFDWRGIMVFCNSSSTIHIDYNTVVLGGKSAYYGTRSECFNFINDVGSSVSLKNNIFHNEMRGDGLNSVISSWNANGLNSDYNTLFSRHPDSLCTLAYTTWLDFAGWKSETGQDAHSSIAPVQFADRFKGDLHIGGASLGDPVIAGIPISGVTIDIDGEQRNPVRPYRGADENTAEPLVLNHRIIATVAGSGTITPSDTVRVIDGFDQIFSFTPHPGYHFDSLIVDGERVDSIAGYTFRNVTTDHFIHAFFSRTMVNVSMHIDAKWNLLSLPLDIVDARGNLFPSASGQAFCYNGSGYATEETLKTGCAYWLRFPEGTDRQFTGGRLDSMVVPVNQGWNMVGGLTDSVAAGNITSDPPAMQISQFFAYQDRYVTSGSLHPGKGYWVKADRPGQLILSTSGSFGHDKAGARAGINIATTSDVPPPPPTVEDARDIDRIPTTYTLEQAYPNPFNPAATIRYQLPVESNVRLTVYSALGQEVALLVYETQEAGYRQIRWNASGVSSGLYYCRMEATSVTNPMRSYTQVQKLLLVK